MTHVKTVKPVRGFVDDPFGFDGAGGRLAYVNADAGYLAEIRILDLSQGAAQLSKIDISKVTTSPTSVRFLDDGFFVISQPEGQQATGLVLDTAGKVKRKFGPADDIVLASRDGNPVVAMYSVVKKKQGKRGPEMFHHQVRLASLDGKKQYGKPRVVISDKNGRIPKLDFRIVYWADGYTRAVGIKGGSWDAAENQRSPDHEAWYDMVTGAFSKRIDIKNLMEHAYLMRVLAQHNNESEFLSVREDRSALELMTGDSRRAVGLATPIRHYDPSSLTYQTSGDGLFFFTLKIDPVNVDAVARKRSDPEYLDLYEYRSGEAKAKRRARFLITSKRKVSWRATEEHWVIVPRLMGFDRGGKELQVYKLK